MSIKVMDWYWTHSKQDGHRLLVLLALADWSNDQGECYPALATLSKRVRRSVRAVQYTISELELDGALVVYPAQGKGLIPGQKSSLYYLMEYRGAMAIALPPIIPQVAQSDRERERQVGRKAYLRKTLQFRLTGATHCTPTGATHCTPTGATHCTLTVNMDPSLVTVIGNRHIEPPPPPIDAANVEAENGGGGGHSSVSVLDLNSLNANALNGQRTDGALRDLAARIIEIVFTDWNGYAGYLDSLSVEKLFKMLTWLWICLLLHNADHLEEYTPDNIREAERITKLYEGVFRGIHNRVAFIRSRVNRGEAAYLDEIDMMDLKVDIEEFQA